MATVTHDRAGDSTPPVRLEVRLANARPITFDLDSDEFLIGSVPGCDLRLPGTNLPPNVCLIRRGPEGVRLRKLTPNLAILLNGQAVPLTGQAILRQGDKVLCQEIGLQITVEIGVAGKTAQFTYPKAEPDPRDRDEQQRREEWLRRQADLEQRGKALEAKAQELDADRVLWYQRREEIERELREAREEIERTRSFSSHPPVDLRKHLEDELAEQFRDRREELERLQLSLREAALELKERKIQHEESLKTLDPRLKELADKEKSFESTLQTLSARENELQRQREAFDADKRLAEARFRQREQELLEREAKARELAEKATADGLQYQTDLVRLDRLAAALETKEHSLTERSRDIDKRYEQFKQDTADFEEHLKAFDDREERVKDEEARLRQRQEELDQREQQLNERFAVIETQQSTLAALRTRLEHIKDELRAQEVRITDERARMEEESRQAQERLKQAESVREQIESEREGHAESYRLYQERSGLMQQAVDRLKATQSQLAQDEERLRRWAAEIEQSATLQAEEEGRIQEKARQLLELQQRIDADRLALKERDAALHEAEQTREVLQEQLRLRSDELAKRIREVDDRNRELDERSQSIAQQLKHLEDLRADAVSHRRMTDEEAALIARRDEQLREAEALIGQQRQMLAEQQATFEQEQAEAAERLAKAREEIRQLQETLAQRTDDLFLQIPDAEARVQGALDRTAQAREAVRGQLAELHTYALRGQEELDSIRRQVQDELQALRDREKTIQAARAEHRLATSAFRQQLIEWQGRFADLKQAMAQSEARIDRKGKILEENEQNLARQAEQVQRQEIEVSEKRVEVDRHLGEMRDWFRRKFREIAEARWSKFHGESLESETSQILRLPERSGPSSGGMNAHDSAILPMPDDLDPADRKLGELLRSLDLVDRETLFALWDESKRQRRTLRQVLLAGGYLTLYQLALIESGNISGLMLGRFRVIDRLMSTPRETIYRVHDPQALSKDGEPATCLLRHLGESEMLDAIRPDEYRMRFGAARDLAHPNIATTWEVLDIHGRPAILQEWLAGLPSNEWPVAVSSPGVWHRLLLQSALGLNAAHTMGLTHGRLSANAFLLTRQGVVKVIGLGEPPWLHSHASSEEPTIEDDLRALGQVAWGWSQSAARRKGAKAKPFGNSLTDILRGLGLGREIDGVASALYPSVANLIDDLDRIADEVPADEGAWDKLLSFVAENSGDGILFRQSA